MRVFVMGKLIIVIAVMFLSACNSDDAQSVGISSAPRPEGLTTQTPGDGVARITVAELKDKVSKGTVVIVDTRTPEAYAQEHIKGAINIPETSVASRAGELPRDKMIVAYCS